MLKQFGSHTLHVSKLQAKMEGILSISSSVSDNPFCKKNATIPGSVCSKCYATRGIKRFKSLKSLLEKNTEVLSKVRFTKEDIPFFNDTIFRFQSHGEINTTLEVENYMTICDANPHCTFTLWTKRPNIVNKVLSKREKPANMILIHSSLMVDREEKLPENFDKVFTVFSSEDAGINCGAKSCITCRKCYNLEDKTVFVREKLK